MCIERERVLTVILQEKYGLNWRNDIKLITTTRKGKMEMKKNDQSFQSMISNFTLERNSNS